MTTAEWKSFTATASEWMSEFRVIAQLLLLLLLLPLLLLFVGSTSLFSVEQP